MTNESAQALAEFLLPQLQQESQTTRKVLAAVPADTCQYKPSDKCMTGLELATHIAAAEAFFLQGVIDGGFTWQQPDLKTPADVVAWYDEKIPALLAQAAALPADKLAQPIKFAMWNEPGGDVSHPQPQTWNSPSRAALRVPASDGREGAADLRPDRGRSD